MEERFDLEKIVPISMIRLHTKTEDVPTVSDDQIAMYRSAAVEAAEQYTGLSFTLRKTIIEYVKLPDLPGEGFRLASKRRRPPVRHHLRAPCADGKVWFYGYLAEPRLIEIEPGADVVKIPAEWVSATHENCCFPCGVTSEDARILYTSGPRHAHDIPQGILVGILKWITWSIENPGDVYRSVDATTSKLSGTLDGTNNVAVASGAMEMWRQYVRRA